MADAADDAAPAVAFKKRRGGQHGKARAREADADPGDSNSTAPTDEAEPSANVSYLLALRQLRELDRKSKSVGIDADRLNSGEVDTRRHKRPRLDDDLALAAAAQAGVSSVQMGLRKARGADDVDDGSRRSRLNETAFTAQTNALDVDRHLLAFIETELRKQRGDDGSEIDAAAELRSLDPRDDLYKIAEKFNLERRKRCVGVCEVGSDARRTVMRTAASHCRQLCCRPSPRSIWASSTSDGFSGSD